MAVEVTLSNIVSGYQTSKINQNFQAIEEALEDALSRTGNTPNSMEADLDMDSNDILNVNDISIERLFIQGTEVTSYLESVGDNGWSPVFGIASDGERRVLQLVAWVGGTGDTPTDHIGEYVGSSGFEASIGSGVDIRGAIGPTGPGTGDMLGAQNLDDVADKPTAFDTIKQAATEIYAGVIEKATVVEAAAGVDTDRAVTPAGLHTLLSTEDLTITGGARVTSKSLGTIASGTLTLDPGDRPLQHYTNNGAHTLAPGSNAGSIMLDITNGASAGTITVSGWTKVVGTFTTTNGHKFRCMCSIGNAGSLLSIQALQ